MKQKSIGITIFTVACAIYAKTEFLESKPKETETARWSVTQSSTNQDSFGLIHKLRYYVLGIGGIGLLIAAEDFLAERAKGRKTTEPARPDHGG